MKLVAAFSRFIGRLPGQTLQQFAAEIKALSELDKAWYAHAFREAGIAIIE